MKYRNFKRRLSKLATVERDRGGARSDWDNHTLPLRIVELKSQAKPCEFNCGRLVQNQLVEHRYVRNTWLNKCQQCGLYQNPSTGEMVDHRTLQQYFRDFNTKKELSE